MKKPLIYRPRFKLLLALVLLIPLITKLPYKPQDTFMIVASVLKKHFIASADWLLAIAKNFVVFCYCCTVYH